ncbi:hypothetical protein F2P79_024731 [Pimephales promelas]|nr:hypothetical protein F2P79_024731 [Pimephales promelas]
MPSKYRESDTRVAGGLSQRSFSRAAARALMMSQLFHDSPDSPHDNDHVRFVFILTPPPRLHAAVLADRLHPAAGDVEHTLWHNKYAHALLYATPAGWRSLALFTHSPAAMGSQESSVSSAVSEEEDMFLAGLDPVLDRDDDDDESTRQRPLWTTDKQSVHVLLQHLQLSLGVQEERDSPALCVMALQHQYSATGFGKG